MNTYSVCAHEVPAFNPRRDLDIAEALGCILPGQWARPSRFVPQCSTTHAVFSAPAPETCAEIETPPREAWEGSFLDEPEYTNGCAV